MESAPST
jgi:hypothetical protein